MLNKLYSFLASFFGVGYTPKMPGTAGSIAACILLFFRPDVSLIIDLAFIFLLIPFSVFICHQADKLSDKHDPGWIVLDEFVGMYVALLGLPRIWWIYLIALVVFRIFDITKPFPISFFEQRLSNGLGIVIDDVIAGMLTGIIFLLFQCACIF